MFIRTPANCEFVWQRTEQNRNMLELVQGGSQGSEDPPSSIRGASDPPGPYECCSLVVTNLRLTRTHCYGRRRIFECR